MLSSEFLITTLIVVLLPGTGVIYTISIGLFQGWRASVLAAIGCTLGIVPHLLATILGLATILHTSAVAFQIVKFIGVAYLFYLAWSMWKETGVLRLEEKASHQSPWRIISRAVLINILNPKLTLFFLAFLPQFVPTYTQTPLEDMLVLSTIFMLLTLIVFTGYGIFANSVRAYLLNSIKVVTYTQRTFAAVFALLGAKLAMTER
ncbi:MAG: LysE family translocator [Epsilonproteobacteria bacterium]|nr:LysE family translocator [Campylobacterota bacterium]